MSVFIWMVHFILVTESAYHKGKFDRKSWQKLTVRLILYIQEEIKCIKTWNRTSGGMLWRER